MKRYLSLLLFAAVTCAVSGQTDVSGFSIGWTGAAGFSVKQSDNVIIANSLLLCMEPPWKNHWYYGAKHNPRTAKDTDGLTVTTDPANTSPFFIEYHRMTVTSPSEFTLSLRGTLKENVPAFITHVVATLPEAVMANAKLSFDGKAIDLAAYTSSSMPQSPEFSECTIASSAYDIRIAIRKGPKLVMQDRREKPYLNVKGFIIMETKGIPVVMNEAFEQEVSFRVTPKTAASAAAPSEIKPAVLRTENFLVPADPSRTLDDIVREESGYNGKFSWGDYRALITELLKPKYRVLSMRDFAADTAKDSVVVGMRHDIDSHPEKALAMAKIEKEAGITSTYYILHSAKYYGTVKNGIMIPNAAISDMAKKLSDRGFEIGIHTDLFSMMWNYQFDDAAFLKAEIARYRDLGIPVTGAAAHGDGTVIGMGLNNMWMFSEFGKRASVITNGFSYPYGRYSVADHGLSYEAYLSSLTPGTRVIMLTHPEHWGMQNETYNPHK